MSSAPRVFSLACPRCHAPLSPSRFAKQLVCPYCGATVRIDETAVDVRTFTWTSHGPAATDVRERAGGP